MTRPTDAAIARAFWAERERFLAPGHGEPVTHGVLLKIEMAAYGFDAESPAGTARGSEEVMQVGPEQDGRISAVARGEEGKTSPPYWLCCGSLNFHEHHRRVCQDTPVICRWGTADEHSAWQKLRPDIVFKFPQKVTTPPERVQIPAESKRVCTISTCRAEMRPGLRCSSPHCGLKDMKT